MLLPDPAFPSQGTGDAAGAIAVAPAEAVEIEVDHRRRIERQDLADEQAADDRDAERLAQLRAVAEADRQRQGAQDRRHGGHQDGPEAQDGGLVDRLGGIEPIVAFALQRHVDHHDGVLLDDADQQQHADHGDDAELHVGDLERQQRADAGRRQGRQDRDRDGCSSRRGCRARCRRRPAPPAPAGAGCSNSAGRRAPCPGTSRGWWPACRSRAWWRSRRRRRR